jgi:hypothetical protein
MKMNTSKVRRFEVKFGIEQQKALRIAERLLDQFYNEKGFFGNYSMPECARN